MDKREIEQRLQAKEHPAKLSIEHWEHNREIVKSDWVLTFEDTSSDSCALCIFNDMHNLDCSRCALTRITGVSCSNMDSLWVNVREKMHRSADKEQLLEAIDLLLSALHEAEVLT